MSANLSNAFNWVLKLHSRTVTIERPGVVGPTEIKVTPSNYFRNLASPSDTIIEGKEFIISKVELARMSYPVPKRGDRIKDSETGLSVISEVRELYGFGASILGYKVRTS